MIDNKILMTIVGLLATVFAINAIQNKREETREDFWGDYPFDISVVISSKVITLSLGNTVRSCDTL